MRRNQVSSDDAMTLLFLNSLCKFKVLQIERQTGMFKCLVRGFDIYTVKISFYKTGVVVSYYHRKLCTG